MIEKKTEEYVKVLSNGLMEIERHIFIFEDGVQIASNIERTTVQPGDDVATKSQRVKDIAEKIWTPNLVNEYKAKITEQLSKLPGKKNV